MADSSTPALRSLAGRLRGSGASTGAGASGRARLPGVDGLRAVAALWVVLFHFQAFSQAKLTHIPGLDLLLRSGSTGVSLFLVLSGFCLYLPFAGGRSGRFATGQFLLRRCRRLLPAYYTSLVAVLALYLVAGAWLGLERLSTAQAAWQLLTHATLTHILFPSSFYSLNGAYWSLGLEWQLYLAMPLLIWGIRRYGLRRTAMVAVACNVTYRLVLAAAIAAGLVDAHGIAATVVLPNQLPGRWAEFVFGMIGAELYVTGRSPEWARKLVWALPVLVPAGFLLAPSPVGHLVFGAIFFIVLTMVVAANNVVAVVMSWRPLVAIGLMSYSLYLVHQPLVQVLAYLLRVHAHTSPNETFGALLILLPFILLVAWTLFMTVERRTLQAHAPARQDRPSPPELAAPVRAAGANS